MEKDFFKKFSLKTTTDKEVYKQSLQSRILEDRKYVARLISRVLNENFDIKKVLLNFPKDSDDPSICAAWHALMHYEADEGKRQNDYLYYQAQMDYLKSIEAILDSGGELPQNIIDEYKNYYGDYLTPHKKDFAGFWHTIKQFMNIRF